MWTTGPQWIDHMTLWVRDMQRSRRFYEAALAPLGASSADFENGPGDPVVMFGPPGDQGFCISEGEPSGPIHIAFHAADRAQVAAFYEAALAAGGRDNGAPGPRPVYHPGYYGAFVLDPDGNNVEAVFHDRSAG
jgi:catechol 2,3-dioxygenase-like lactoylglutathione lyase family enzyme